MLNPELTGNLDKVAIICIEFDFTRLSFDNWERVNDLAAKMD